MPQHVPEIEWTEDALELRQFVFDYWGENRRAPNLASAWRPSSTRKWRRRAKGSRIVSPRYARPSSRRSSCGAG